MGALLPRGASAAQRQWLLPPPPPPRPFWVLIAPPPGGREQLCAARRPPRKLFCAAERVSELVPRWGATGVCRNTRPTCVALLQLRELLQGTFLKNHPVSARCLPQKRLWKAALGGGGKKPWRGAFALAVQASGRTVVGNAVSAGPDGVATFACRGPTRLRDRAALERSSGDLRHPTAGDRLHAETIPKRSLRFVFSRIHPL